MLLRATQRALRRGARQKSTVVMMRHGESTWNLENKFTGEDRGARNKSGLLLLPRREASTPIGRRRAAARASGPASHAIESGLRAQAGTTAPSRRKVMKKQRRPADSSPRKVSNLT